MNYILFIDEAQFNSDGIITIARN